MRLYLMGHMGAGWAGKRSRGKPLRPEHGIPYRGSTTNKDVKNIEMDSGGGNKNVCEIKDNEVVSHRGASGTVHNEGVMLERAVVDRTGNEDVAGANEKRVEENNEAVELYK